ncbi:SAF domain-containing protein [Aquisalibacillus elongatus]|uniref:Flp pilus assembly protein CpaB n=1 Tax=Aquisalibacillus elongatus TaxID=485577 RepID=A0A3N5C1L6_9BACI|nr:SAF domain-containing protein [Aquisalibacillus elongatus]RPF50071.1 Flp pilus assembly protein CpaB [Aquisalibacillus elongatus]
MVEAKRKAFIFILLAFILAIIAAGLIIQQLQAIAESTSQTIEVAVASEEIDSYEEFNDSNVDWVDVPLTDQAENFIQQKSDLEDSISIVNLEAGNYITSNMVREKSSIPPNERIVRLDATDNVMKDEAIGEGDNLDIIVVYDTDEGTTVSPAFRDVPVVEVNGEEVLVRMDIEVAQELIYYQNIAKQIRVLRVSNSNAQVEEQSEGE